MSKPRRIGVIGAGTIANALIHSLGGADIAVTRVLVSERRLAADPHHPLYTTDVEELAGLDLVVEAATPEAYAAYAPRLLRSTDVCGFSCTALADAGVMAACSAAAAASGRRLFVPHGAIVGLDGLADGRDVITGVTITTTKSGAGFGVDPEAEGTLYEGPTRAACQTFPRNVNVHAAVALAGIGFDRTVSHIIAKPGLKTMQHRIQVTGHGIEWDINVASRSLGGVTGQYTPHSAVGSVLRILGGAGIGFV